MLRKEQIDPEIYICPKCEEPLPVTDEYFYRVGRNKVFNLSICKKCHKKYFKERYAKLKAERIERARPKPEFDEFSKAALKDQFKRAREPIASIFRDIL